MWLVFVPSVGTAEYCITTTVASFALFQDVIVNGPPMRTPTMRGGGSGMTKTVNDLNPRAQAVKQLEMTVRRGLELIEEFEKLEDGQDWLDVPGSAYRRIIGERYQYPLLLSTAWTRFKSGTLYREVLELAANLPESVLEKEELDGLDKIRDRFHK